MQENIPPSSPFGMEEGFDGKAATMIGSPRPRRSPLKIPSASSPATSPTKRRDSDPFLSQQFHNQDRDRVLHDEEDDSTSSMADDSFGHGQAFNPDDTCFSNFSAVPNTDMTAFAGLSRSPARAESPSKVQITPSRQTKQTAPDTVVPRKLNLSPSKAGSRRYEDTMTTQLLEFTEQINYSQSSTRTLNQGGPLSPSRLRSEPNLLAGASHRLRSPDRNGYNLLDFDLPPAPTPRSVPSISARELESLKAGFLSEISSLKAKLSGYQAETQFLQNTKDDAERRIGELSEELRDAKGEKESLIGEKSDWERRDKEMQEILREIKTELVLGEKERSELQENLEDREKGLKAAEARASEAESKLAGLQTQVESQASPAMDGSNSEGSNPATPGSSNNAVEVAVEKVARELHALYKTKHEHKVGALKKSYEARWERRVKELETKVGNLTRENEDLKLGRDATMSGLVPAAMKQDPVESPGAKERREKAREEREAELKRLGVENEGIKKEAADFQLKLDACEKGIARLENDNKQLASDLEASRKENSELVTAVEEMLQLESKAPAAPAPAAMEPEQHQPTRPSSLSNASDGGMRNGGIAPASKLSGLRGPGFGSSHSSESRIGTMKRSTSGTGSRSGIMSNIERMGKGRGVE